MTVVVDAAMELKISTYDKPSMEQMYGLFPRNRTIKLGDGAELTFQGIEFKKAEGFPEVAAFLVSVSAHVPAVIYGRNALIERHHMVAHPPYKTASRCEEIPYRGERCRCQRIDTAAAKSGPRIHDVLD